MNMNHVVGPEEVYKLRILIDLYFSAHFFNLIIRLDANGGGCVSNSETYVLRLNYFLLLLLL